MLLQNEVLNALRKRPQSGRSLTRLLRRDHARVLAVCRGLAQAGRIRRDGKKWVAVPGAEVPEIADSPWTIDQARAIVGGYGCTKAAIADPQDGTLLGSTRRTYDEAVEFLTLHDPGFILTGNHEREQAIQVFNVLRQADAHDREAFLTIVDSLTVAAYDVIAPIVARFRTRLPESRIDGRRVWFVWLLMGRPDPMPSEFRFRASDVEPPARDEAQLGMARNLAASTADYRDDEAGLLLDMLLVLDEETVFDAIDSMRAGLAQEPLTQSDIAEPLEV